jgi:hypothetical protein
VTQEQHNNCISISGELTGAAADNRLKFHQVMKTDVSIKWKLPFLLSSTKYWEDCLKEVAWGMFLDWKLVAHIISFLRVLWSTRFLPIYER